MVCQTGPTYTGIKPLVIFQTKSITTLYFIQRILSVVTWYVGSPPTDEKQVMHGMTIKKTTHTYNMCKLGFCDRTVGGWHANGYST